MQLHYHCNKGSYFSHRQDLFWSHDLFSDHLVLKLRAINHSETSNNIAQNKRCARVHLSINKGLAAINFQLISKCCQSCLRFTCGCFFTYLFLKPQHALALSTATDVGDPCKSPDLHWWHNPPRRKDGIKTCASASAQRCPKSLTLGFLKLRVVIRRQNQSL